MAHQHFKTFFYSLAAITLFSCHKQVQLGNPENDGPSLNQPGTNINCNDTKQQLVKRTGPQPGDSLVVNYHSNGNLNSINIYSELRKPMGIVLIYENGKPIGGALRDPDGDFSIDTVKFRYDDAGRIDSMYLLYDNSVDRRFEYNKNGQLSKLIRYSKGEIAYYYEIQNNAFGDIERFTYWANGPNGIQKQNEASMEWDDRKNPFASLGIFMYYLESEEQIFQLTGPHNFKNMARQKTITPDQSLSEGNKLVYNKNCYPQAAYSIINGFTQQSEPDIRYEYK